MTGLLVFTTISRKSST